MLRPHHTLIPGLVCLLVSLSAGALAETFIVDLDSLILGDPGNSFEHGREFSTPNGQQLVYDIQFRNAKYIQLNGPGTYEFWMGVRFHATNTVPLCPPNPSLVYFVDGNGAQIPGSQLWVGCAPGIFGYNAYFRNNTGPVQVHGLHVEFTLPLAEPVVQLERYAYIQLKLNQPGVTATFEGPEVISSVSDLDLGQDGTYSELLGLGPEGFPTGLPLDGQVLEVILRLASDSDRVISVSDPAEENDAELELRFEMSGTHAASIPAPAALEGSLSFTPDQSSVPGIPLASIARPGQVIYPMRYAPGTADLKFNLIIVRLRLPQVPGSTLQSFQVDMVPAQGQELQVTTTVPVTPSTWGQIKAEFRDATR